MRDRQVDHLLGGPNSSRLEFTSDFYREEAAASRQVPFDEFLRKCPPSCIQSLAVQRAAYDGLEFFGHPNNEVGPSGIELRYKEAGNFAIAGYIALDRIPDFTVDQLPFARHLNVPEAELREVARLALQRFTVYEAIVETGEVPEL